MNKNRAYSVLTCKEVQEDDSHYFIEGTASTPSPDRMGDIVEPTGAKFQTPMPLLWQHYRDKPVGEVTFAKASKAGIPFKAQLPKVKEAGALRDRIEEAVQSIKYNLLSAVSIGFRAIEDKYEFMEDGGIKFLEWEWLELSLVTIPANSEATLKTIQTIDQELIAASGTKELPGMDRPEQKPAGVTAKPALKKVKLIKPEEGKHMNILEDIKNYQATRAAKVAELQALMEKSSEAGESLDASESENFDALEGEIAAIDKHLVRLNKMKDLDIQTAKPVDDVSGVTERNNKSIHTISAKAKIHEKLEKGIEFARYVMCLGAAKGELATASRIAEKRFPNSERINMVLRAAVDAGTTTDPAWAGTLVEYNDFAGDFVEFLRPQTILGRFGMDGIPSLFNIPFNIHIKGQTVGGAGYWVGQGKAKPLTKFGFNDVYHGFSKVANIAVLTQELVRFSNPAAESLVRKSLADALIERMDTDFIDPNKAAEANVSPASITNGVTQIPASGTDADAVRADIKAVLETFIAANITPSTGVWIMSQSTALTLSLMRNALGGKEFPDINMQGGMLESLPVITSEYVQPDSDGGFMILVNAGDVYLSDDGQVVIDASREASLQMDDSPTMDSDTPTPATSVSMFQTNSMAIRAERFINWSKRRDAAVGVISHVNYA